MTSNYCTVVPMVHVDAQLSTPVEFAKGLCFSSVPSWLLQDKWFERLSASDRDTLNRSHYAFIAEYTAASLGDPDPEYRGADHRSIQDAKFEAVVLANLSLWLVKSSLACFDMVFHCPLFGQNWNIQKSERHSRLLCHPYDQDAVLTNQDIEDARKLHSQMSSVDTQKSVWTAIHSTWSALQIRKGDIRYLLFWIALEALFGPEDGHEMTFRLSQRISTFLSTDGKEALELFRRVKKLYETRSKIAHGVLKTGSDLIDKGCETETLIRRALVKILGDDNFLQAFCGKGRESFLDELAFRF